MDWYRNGRKGAQGELIAAVDLTDRGFEVFRAIDPVASTDLIAHRDGKSWRVQVKTGSPLITTVKPGKQEITAWVNVSSRSVRYRRGYSPPESHPSLSISSVKLSESVLIG